MASIWVKILGGGFLAAAVGSAIGESIPVEERAMKAAPSQAVAASPSKPTTVAASKPTTVAPSKPAIEEKTARDYPLVKQAAAMSAKGDGLGLLINLAGELCAEVISSDRLRGDHFEVVCREYRGGSGLVRYQFNASNGESRRLG